MSVIAKSKNGKFLDVRDPEFQEDFTVDGDPICEHCFTATGKKICDDCQEAINDIFGRKINGKSHS